MKKVNLTCKTVKTTTNKTMAVRQAKYATVVVRDNIDGKVCFGGSLSSRLKTVRLFPAGELIWHLPIKNPTIRTLFSHKNIK